MVSHRGAIGSSPMANGGNGDDPPAVMFTCAPGRSGSHAMDILKGFNGILHVDGHAGYDALADPRRVGGTPLTLACCRAHARRKLHDITQKDGSEIAAKGLRRIAFAHCPRTDGGQRRIPQDRSRQPRSRTRRTSRCPPGTTRLDDRRLAATG